MNKTHRPQSKHVTDIFNDILSNLHNPAKSYPTTVLLQFWSTVSLQPQCSFSYYKAITEGFIALVDGQHNSTNFPTNAIINTLAFLSLYIPHPYLSNRSTGPELLLRQYNSEDRAPSRLAAPHNIKTIARLIQLRHEQPENTIQQLIILAATLTSRGAKFQEMLKESTLDESDIQSNEKGFIYAYLCNSLLERGVQLQNMILFNITEQLVRDSKLVMSAQNGEYIQFLAYIHMLTNMTLQFDGIPYPKLLSQCIESLSPFYSWPVRYSKVMLNALALVKQELVEPGFNRRQYIARESTVIDYDLNITRLEQKQGYTTSKPIFYLYSSTDLHSLPVFDILLTEEYDPMLIPVPGNPDDNDNDNTDYDDDSDDDNNNDIDLSQNDNNINNNTTIISDVESSVSHRGTISSSDYSGPAMHSTLPRHHNVPISAPTPTIMAQVILHAIGLHENTKNPSSDVIRSVSLLSHERLYYYYHSIFALSPQLTELMESFTRTLTSGFNRAATATASSPTITSPAIQSTTQQQTPTINTHSGSLSTQTQQTTQQLQHPSSPTATPSISTLTTPMHTISATPAVSPSVLRPGQSPGRVARDAIFAIRDSIVNEIQQLTMATANTIPTTPSLSNSSSIPSSSSTTPSTAATALPSKPLVLPVTPQHHHPFNPSLPPLSHIRVNILPSPEPNHCLPQYNMGGGGTSSPSSSSSTTTTSITSNIPIPSTAPPATQAYNTLYSILSSYILHAPGVYITQDDNTIDGKRLRRIMIPNKEYPTPSQLTMSLDAHPNHAESLKRTIRFVIVGSDPILQHVVSAYYRLRIVEPLLFNVLDVRFYIIPTTENHLSSYLARHDMWYQRHIYYPFRAKIPILPWVDSTSGHPTGTPTATTSNSTLSSSLSIHNNNNNNGTLIDYKDNLLSLSRTTINDATYYATSFYRDCVSQYVREALHSVQCVVYIMEAVADIGCKPVYIPFIQYVELYKYDDYIYTTTTTSPKDKYATLKDLQAYKDNYNSNGNNNTLHHHTMNNGGNNNMTLSREQQQALQNDNKNKDKDKDKDSATDPLNNIKSNVMDLHIKYRTFHTHKGISDDEITDNNVQCTQIVLSNVPRKIDPSSTRPNPTTPSLEMFIALAKNANSNKKRSQLYIDPHQHVFSASFQSSTHQRFTVMLDGEQYGPFISANISVANLNAHIPGAPHETCFFPLSTFLPFSPF